VARMEVNPECMEKLLAVLMAYVPIVLTEDGCLRYEPCIDATEETRGKFITILESWASEAHLKAHLLTSALQHFRDDVKDLRHGSDVKLLIPVIMKY